MRDVYLPISLSNQIQIGSGIKDQHLILKALNQALVTLSESFPDCLKQADHFKIINVKTDTPLTEVPAMKVKWCVRRNDFTQEQFQKLKDRIRAPLLPYFVD